MSKINKIDYQRNGISGNGFYVAELKVDGKKVIATFEVDYGGELGGNKEKIKEETCRVVNPTDLTDKYRGDDIAHDLQYQFQKLKERKWESEKHKKLAEA